MNVRTKIFLAAFPLCLCMLGCNDHAGSEKAKALQAEIDQLSKLNNEAQQSSRRLESQIDASRQEKEKLKAEREKLEADRDAAVKELDLLKKAFDHYKSQYKLSMQRRAPGLQVPDFEVNGVVYRNVTLKELNDSLVNFTYDGGVRKLNTDLLPDAMQDLLGVNLSSIQEERTQVTMSNSPRHINATRLTEYDMAVVKARADIGALRNQLEEAHRNLSQGKQRLNYAATNHEDSTPLKKFIDQQQAYIAKLDSQLTQLTIKEYEVTQERPKLQALK